MTEIDFNLSTINKISCGVPQGFVLGPLLFLIYINDFHNSSEKFSFYLFADDTNLLYANKILNLLKKRSIINCSESRIGSMQIS